MIYSLHKAISKINFSEYDYVIYNNDGAFQRVILYYLNSFKILLMQGILSGNEHSKNKFFMGINILSYKLLYKIFPEYLTTFFPSILGISNPKYTLVYTKYCMKYLLRNKLYHTEYKIIGFPKSIKNENKNHLVKKIKNIVFIGQSFNWHGLNDYNDYG